MTEKNLSDKNRTKNILQSIPNKNNTLAYKIDMNTHKAHDYVKLIMSSNN